MADSKKSKISKAQKVDLPCPIRTVISHISDKWCLLILQSLNEAGTQRYKDIRSNIPDISEKMLSQSLRQLQKNGLITRKLYGEVPPRVEYSLSMLALGLMSPLQELIAWANEAGPAIRDARGE